jgi:hypothetical protein
LEFAAIQLGTLSCQKNEPKRTGRIIVIEPAWSKFPSPELSSFHSNLNPKCLSGSERNVTKTLQNSEYLLDRSQLFRIISHTVSLSCSLNDRTVRQTERLSGLILLRLYLTRTERTA